MTSSTKSSEKKKKSKSSSKQKEKEGKGKGKKKEEEEERQLTQRRLNLDFTAWYQNKHLSVRAVECEEKLKREGKMHLLSPPSHETLQQVVNRAKELYEREAALQGKPHSSDERFLSKVVKTGPLKDRMAAVTVQLEESPLFHLPLLETVLSLGKKPERRLVELAIQTLREIFLMILPDRKLKYFADRPIVVESVTDSDLVYWYFEDQMKKLYLEFIQIMEVLSCYYSLSNQIESNTRYHSTAEVQYIEEHFQFTQRKT